MQVVTFYLHNLSFTYRMLLIGFLSLHILAHYWHMEADKNFTRLIPKILAQVDDDVFYSELLVNLAQNLGFLLLCIGADVVTEIITKLAIKNAVDKASQSLLRVKLNTIAKSEYEYAITSLTHHIDNVTSAVHNIFIEFPRKALACYHFVLALTDLSWNVMIYCTVINILFALGILCTSYARKYIMYKIVDANTKLSITCSDLSNSIQTYKVDDRLTEYEIKMRAITKSVWYLSSTDAMLAASTDVLTTFSVQFVIGTMACLIRPLFLDGKILIADLLYGIKSAGKFVEKFTNVVEYGTDVIRQYQSFAFFARIQRIKQDVSQPPSAIHPAIHHLRLASPTEEMVTLVTLVTLVTNVRSEGQLIRLVGANGTGKTTCLFKFLGVEYAGSHTKGEITGRDVNDSMLLPEQYMRDVGIITQNVPITYDTVDQYMRAVSRINTDAKVEIELIRALDYYGTDRRTNDHITDFITHIDPNQRIRELSGGQAKMVQILAAILKVYTRFLPIIILDEPTNNLDRDKIHCVQNLLDCMIATGTTIICVYHGESLRSDHRSELNLDQ